LDERLSRIAEDYGCGPLSPGCGAFRGIDTLAAPMLHLELSADWQRFRSPRRQAPGYGVTPTLD
jgi:hypothetical protein